jgi:hypothetical protein
VFFAQKTVDGSEIERNDYVQAVTDELKVRTPFTSKYRTLIFFCLAPELGLEMGVHTGIRSRPDGVVPVRIR